jgi:hypothetical protein
MKKYKLPFPLTELNTTDISIRCKHQLFDFLIWLEDSLLWASKETHYQDLDVWVKGCDQKISNYLKDNGFINGDRDHNDKLPDVRFWWTIYGYDPTNSPNLKTSVRPHHASAFERASATLSDLNHVFEQLTKPENFLLLVEESDGTAEALNEWNIKNRMWLRKSQKIALKVLDALERQGLSKDILPNPKVVYGVTDLKLSEISEIEKILNIKL